MAVSARLVRKLQQTLGDDEAEDLVHWMTQMDGRDSDLQIFIARIDNWREMSRADVATLREASRADIATLREASRADVATLRAEIANARADTIKWSFVFWAANLLTMLGVMMTLASLGAK